MKNNAETLDNHIPAWQAQTTPDSTPCVLVSYYRPTMTEGEYALVGRLLNDLRAGGVDARPDEVRDTATTVSLQPVLSGSYHILLVQNADSTHSAQLEERLAAQPHPLEAPLSTRVLRVCVAPGGVDPKRADLAQPSTYNAYEDYPRALAGILLALQPGRQGNFFGVTPGAAPPPSLPTGHTRLTRFGLGTLALLILLILSMLATHIFDNMSSGKTTYPASRPTLMTENNGTQSSPQTNTPTPQSLYAQITSQVPTIDDPLKAQDTNYWGIKTTEHRTCAFQSDGAYHIKAMRTPGQNSFMRTVCLEKATSPTDFAAQVDMQLLQGSVGGLVFRAQGQTTYYWFSLDSQGCSEMAFSSSTGKSKILSPKSQPCLPQPMQSTVQLTVIARGTIFYLYINGHFVYHINDTNLPGPGQLGMIAIDRPTNPAISTEVAFTHLKIWKVSPP